MTKIEKEKEQLRKIMEAAAKKQAKIIVAEQQEKERQAKQAAKERARERAALFRSADAHEKIKLGGLTIAAGANDWDTGEIVGALLHMAERMNSVPGLRATLRDKGIAHLEARAAAREAAKS